MNPHDTTLRNMLLHDTALQDAASQDADASLPGTGAPLHDVRLCSTDKTLSGAASHDTTLHDAPLQDATPHDTDGPSHIADTPLGGAAPHDTTLHDAPSQDAAPHDTDELSHSADAPLIFDTSDGQQLRINTINTFLKKQFGQKVAKLSLDGGFTCPNRDGSKATGGCSFCSASGSGDTAAGTGDIACDLETQIQALSGKWPNAGYIAYFQSHTNTYAPVDELREKFYAALSHPRVIGLAIATRPDCLPDEVIALLAELNRKTFLWVELGLQSIHAGTMKAMNLCYTRADYDDAVDRLSEKGIRIVTHLILGLPGESPAQMLESVKYACTKKIFGLKLHMLNLVKGSQLARTHPEYVSFQNIEDYIDLVISAIELVPPEITLHRITADAPRASLISPAWSYKKRTILNGIHKTMRQRNSWQGKGLHQP